MKFTRFILLEVEQKLEISLPKAFSMFCYEKQNNFGLLSSSTYNQINFFLIFVSIYEYIKSMFFCFDLNFYRHLISSIFIQKSLMGTKLFFVLTVCYFPGENKQKLALLWNKSPNCSVASCTLLVGLEPPTFILTAERASRLRHKSRKVV